MSVPPQTTRRCSLAVFVISNPFLRYPFTAAKTVLTQTVLGGAVFGQRPKTYLGRIFSVKLSVYDLTSTSDSAGTPVFVAQWMTPEPKSVSSKTPVMEAMQLLRKGGYRRLPVVDGGRLVGIVTDRDLKDANPSSVNTLSVYELNYLLSKLVVREVMTRPVITVSPEDPVEQASLLMEEHKISGLPVVEDGKLTGMLTITDMLRAFVAMLGLRDGGTRVTVSLPDEPGVLARAASAAAPSNIIAVVTAGVEAGSHRELVLRVVGEGAAEFPERLKAAGLEVKDIR